MSDSKNTLTIIPWRKKKCVSEMGMLMFKMFHKACVTKSRHTHPLHVPSPHPICLHMVNMAFSQSTTSHTQLDSLSPSYPPTIFTIPLPPFPLTTSIPCFPTKADSLPAVPPTSSGLPCFVSLLTRFPLPEPSSHFSSLYIQLFSVLHPQPSCHFLQDHALTSGPKALDADSPTEYPGIKARPPAALY